MYSSKLARQTTWMLMCHIFWMTTANGQLLINVKNQGGDVVQETITANVTDNTITLEFQRPDGTLITHLIDFNNDVQILKALVLGEEERGQSHYQVMCFVSYFDQSDSISTDAMAKLRQKNPGNIRSPEEDRGRFNVTMDYFVDISKSSVISRQIGPLCNEAEDAIYTRHHDLLMWALLPGNSEDLLRTAVQPFPISIQDEDETMVNERRQSSLATKIYYPNIKDKRNHIQFGHRTNEKPKKHYQPSVKESSNDASTKQNSETPNERHGSSSTTSVYLALMSCKETASSHLKLPCICHIEVCIGWYPCGLKYCQSKTESASADVDTTISYRCGIRTCKKCYLFAYFVYQKQFCIWDE